MEELKQLAHTHFAEIQGLGEAQGQGLASTPEQGLGSTQGQGLASASASEQPTKLDRSSEKSTCHYPFQQGGVIVRLRPIKEVRDVSDVIVPYPDPNQSKKVRDVSDVILLL